MSTAFSIKLPVQIVSFDLEPNVAVVPTDKVYKTADDFNVAVMGCYSNCMTQVSILRSAANIGVII